MPVLDVTTDTERNTLTVTSHFAAPVERVWQVWADPRQLEKWWGPEGYPATVTAHELVPGGRVDYYMTSPEGEKFGGYWTITTVQEPRRLEYSDGFADASGHPVEDMPTSSIVVELTEADGGTSMVITNSYASAADLQKVLAMGMEEGIRSAANQLDALLAT